MKRIGQLLLDLDWISPQDLQHALTTQRAMGGKLGTCLLEQDSLSEDRLMRALSHQLEVPHARAADLCGIPQQVLDLVPASMALRHRAVPFRMIGTELYLAMLDVGNLESRDQISMATAKSVRVHIGNEMRILVALGRYYGGSSDERFLQLEARLDHVADTGRPGRSEGVASAGDVIRRLGVAQNPEAIAAELLAYLSPKFSRVALFQALSHGVRGWRGSGLTPDGALAQVRLGFHEPSVFLELKAGKRAHIGRLSKVPAHRVLERSLGERPLSGCFVIPVHVGRRLAAVILCELPEGGPPPCDAQQLERIADAAGQALARCIQRAKSGANGDSGDSNLGADGLVSTSAGTDEALVDAQPEP